MLVGGPCSWALIPSWPVVAHPADISVNEPMIIIHNLAFIRITSLVALSIDEKPAERHPYPQKV
jgi:hypothetical protein